MVSGESVSWHAFRRRNHQKDEKLTAGKLWLCCWSELYIKRQAKSNRTTRETEWSPHEDRPPATNPWWEKASFESDAIVYVNGTHTAINTSTPPLPPTNDAMVITISRPFRSFTPIYVKAWRALHNWCEDPRNAANKLSRNVEQKGIDSVYYYICVMRTREGAKEAPSIKGSMEFPVSQIAESFVITFGCHAAILRCSSSQASKVWMKKRQHKEKCQIFATHSLAY